MTTTALGQYAQHLRRHADLRNELVAAVRAYHDTPFVVEGRAYPAAYERVLKAAWALSDAADNLAQELARVQR